jgi:hypothetical protein
MDDLKAEAELHFDGSSYGLLFYEEIEGFGLVYLTTLEICQT